MRPLLAMCMILENIQFDLMYDCDFEWVVDYTQYSLHRPYARVQKAFEQRNLLHLQCTYALRDAKSDLKSFRGLPTYTQQWSATNCNNFTMDVVIVDCIHNSIFTLKNIVGFSVFGSLFSRLTLAQIECAHHRNKK